MVRRIKYRYIPGLIGAAIGVSISIGFASRNPLIPVITTLIGLSIYLLIRGRIEKPIHDERTSLIHAKASSATFALFVLGSYFVGAILLMMDRMGYTGYYQIGTTIFVMGFTFSILHYFFRYYYHSKFGG